MRKFILGLAVAASALTAGAADFKFTYTVTPEPGEVTELNEINLNFPEFEWMDIYIHSYITLTRDGESIKITSDAAWETPDITIIPSTTQTETGTYVLNIPAGTIVGSDYDWNSYNSPEDITVTWTICTTGVEARLAEQEGETIVYNLQGVRIMDTENLPSGIYIINGKKVRK